MPADLEDQKRYEAYKSALNDGSVLDMHYLKILFFGPPRTGKSTARRRLVQEIDNLDSLGEPSASTGLAETNEVIIKKLTNETAVISDSHWLSMKGEDISYRIHLYRKLISKIGGKPKKTNNVQVTASKPVQSDSGPVSDVKQNESIESVGTKGKDTVEQKSTALPTLPNLPHPRPMAEKPEENSVQQNDSEKMELDETLRNFQTIIESESPDDIHKFLEDLKMLNMVDVGGQPAFLELCPAFTAGPALYFIFFRLDQDLEKVIEVKFMSGIGNEVKLNSSYCTQTVICQALSSIACFGSHSMTENAKSSHLSGRALLFGTYKDRVDGDCIRQINSTLYERFKNTELYKQELLLKVSNTEFFHSLNNMTGDESEMSPIRENIEKIIKKFFPPLPISASWLMFRVILLLRSNPIVTIAECTRIAHYVSMSTPVQDAIWFFHHYIGSLMHYPDIPSMKDIVICDTQVVFDTTSELIIDTFKVDNMDSKITQVAVDDFKEKGQFSLAHIKDRTVGHRNNRLSLEQLVDLLKYHNIIAEICPEQKKLEQLESNQEILPQFTADQESSAKPDPKISAQTTNPIFIMPAVLQEASEEELKLVSSSVSTQEVSPLMIYFVSGFVPFGVFCASIANLIACLEFRSPRWQLCDGQVMKNKVNFYIDESFVATLISRPQYLEIRVKKHEGTTSNYLLKYICSTVRQRFVQTLETVIAKMKHRPYVEVKSSLFTIDQTFDLAFMCCLCKSDSHGDHLMIVDKNNGKCLKKNLRVILEKKHRIWFSEVSYIYTKSFSHTSCSCVVIVLIKTLIPPAD